MTTTTKTLFFCWCLLLGSCTYDFSVEVPGDDTGTGPDADTDGDTDTDSDSDVDSDDEVDTAVNTDHTCFDKVCNTPPTPTCDSSGPAAVRVYQSTGWCDDGTCHYDSRLETCSSGTCNLGRCPANLCEHFDCHDPPPLSCAGGSNIAVSHRVGRCRVALDTDSVADRSCLYDFSPQPCVSGCEIEPDASWDTSFDTGTETTTDLVQGHCIEQPCHHAICDNPPASYCDVDKLVIYAAAGRCGDNGKCTYGFTSRQCPNGCQNGRCSLEICKDIQCGQPPANYCEDTDNLRAFRPRGTCSIQDSTPVCHYKFDSIPCTSGSCQDGQCDNDPCLGIEKHCELDSSFVRVIDKDTTTGVDTEIDTFPYPPAFNGPTEYCSHDTDNPAQITWNRGPGTCQDGVCIFGYFPIPMPSCQDGVHAEQQCTSINCTATPANYCDGNERVEYLPPWGTCVGENWCNYESVRQICGGGCDPILAECI